MNEELKHRLEELDDPKSKALLLSNLKDIHDKATLSSEESLSIAVKIQGLAEEEIVKFLFCKKASKPNFKHFSHLIETSDTEVAIHLIQALDKIDKKKLLNLCQTSSFPARYEGFIAVFKKTLPDELAFSLLKLLDQYDWDDLRKLVYGYGHPFNLLNFNYNLLHAVLEFQSETVISALFLILKKAAIEDLKVLLSEIHVETNQTAVEYAFARHDKPAIGLMLAQKLSKTIELRPLFTHVSTLQPFSIMHNTVTNNNALITAYFLEQPESQHEHLSVSKETMLKLAIKGKHQDIITLFKALPILEHIDRRNRLRATDINRIIEESPEILSCPWTDQKTLLHHAAAQGLSNLVFIYRKSGCVGGTQG